MPSFFNQASLSYNDIITNSNVVQGSYSDQLTISRSTINDYFCTDELITVVVGIANSCTSASGALTLTDDLGAYAFGESTLYPLSYVTGSARLYLNGVEQPAPTVTAGPPLTITGLNVPAGGNLLLLYSARANSYAPLGADASITGTATLTGGSLTAPASAQSTLEAACRLQLSINKAVSPSEISCGSPVTYTLTLQNSGSNAAVATDNVIITDIFNPVLNISEVRFNGELWQNPENYSYNSATGVFTSALGQITVPAASFTQDANTGAWSVTPGTSILTITGTISSDS